MVNEYAIKQVAVQLGITTQAEYVILFGSYARAQATDNSDVDLLIVAQSNLPRFKRSRELYKLFCPYPFSMDLLVYTPQEIEKGKQSALSFVSTVLKEGKILYVSGNRNSSPMDSQSQK